MLNEKEQFFRLISEAKNLSLVLNKNWTNDGVAAGLALSQLLLKLDCKITLSADQANQQDNLSWLPFFPFIQPDLDLPKEFIISLDISQTKIADLQYRLTEERLDIVIAQEYGMLSPQQLTARSGDFPYQAIIAIGCSDLDGLGCLYQNYPMFFQQTNIVNLDCSTSNEEYGQLNIINVKTSSVSEMVYQLFADQPELIDADIATCLLTGIIAATNNFKTANLCPQTLTAAADLMRLGAKHETIIKQLYRNKKLAILKLWGNGLANLHTSEDQKLAWTFFDYTQIKNARFKRQDLLNLIEELISNLPALEAALIFIAKPQETSVFIYTLKNFDALSLSKNYQGHGNKKLAQALISAPLEDAIKELVPIINAELNN